MRASDTDDLPPGLRFLRGGGRATALILARDWSAHPLGAPEAWPEALKVSLSTILNSPESMILAWGAEELTYFFNDTYAPLLGPRVAWAMGSSFAEVWADGWGQAKPIIDDAFAGRAMRHVDMPWKLATDRGRAETWFTFSYSRVLDADGEIAGLFIIASETTDRVLGRAAETRNRQIIDSVADYAIVATDLSGIVTRWSKGAERVLGWAEEEMLGRPADVFFTPEDVAGGRPEEEMHEARTDGRATDERWHQRKGGERFFAMGELTPLREDDGTLTGFVKVLRDRTEERLAAETLRQTEDRLRRAQEAGGVGVFAVGRDGILHPSAEFCRLYGMPERDTYPATEFERLVIPEDEALVSTAQKRLDGRAPLDVEYRIRRADTGALRWIARRGDIERDADGMFARFVGVARDITEQVEVQRTLAAEREQLAQMFEQAPTFMALLRGPDHVFERVNPGFVRLIDGRNPVGHGVREALPDAVDQGFIALLDEVYRTGEPFSAENQLVLVQATPGEAIKERYADFVYQPIRDADGRVSGIFIEGADVTERVRAQQEIDASQLQFHTFAQAVPNHVWTASADGSLGWCNDRIIEYGGLSRDALAGADWPDLVHPDDRPAASARWAASIATGDQYETEFRIRRADGDYRWHLVRALPIRTGGRVVRWIGTNTDIHEQKLAEAQTAQDRDRLWNLSQDLMLVCDFDGLITAVNPSATRLLGWEQHEMAGKRLADFIHPDDLGTTAAQVAALSRGLTTLTFENRYRRRDGSYRTLDWNAVPDAGRIHAVGRDVTQERSLARDRERIWTLSPVLKVVGSPQGDIITINPSWTKVLGWTADESVGRNLLEFVAPEERGAGELLFVGADPEASIVERQQLFATRDGGRRRIAWTMVRENDTLYAFGRDITAETESAQALAATEEALRQSQKMEAVGQLTGGIAHDFNNLLQGITGSLEIIQRRVAQGRTGELDRFISGATTAANRAAALTHRLLAFSRRQPLDPRPVRVNPLVASMEDLLRRTIGERIDFEMVLGGGLWLTLCDPNQLENAILNLVINARDAMPDGGKLTIETCNAHLDDAYAARQRDVRPGQYVCVCVSDTGTGMTADTIAKAFEPFFTTKPIGQGTGLGLSMIYGFARQSEGYAKIYSELGQGTTFKLYLPRHRGEAEAEEETPRLSDAHATDEGEVVLVVEDEPVVRGLIVETLSELGYRAIEAADGPSGVDLLLSTRRIDLLVTDIGLPGLNGRQVADAGRQQRPELKVLFMTGYAENAALASGFLEPGMTMITKPFAMEALATRIRAMIEG